VDGRLVAHALYVDSFGNVELNIGHEDLSELGLKLGRAVVLQAPTGPLDVTYARTFADVAPGEPLVYEDAYRRLSIAVSHGSAADRLRLKVGDELRNVEFDSVSNVKDPAKARMLH